MKIEVVTAEGDEKHRVFQWHGDGTAIDDLAVGETKTITDADGNEVTLKRTEDGLEIEVEGETIEVLHPHGDSDAKDAVIMEHRMVKVVKAGDGADVTIISADKIDDETRAKLQEVLRASGTEGEIMFIDGSELHGHEQAGTRREVRVIKKKVDATN